jgi:hypothetical protein
VRLDAAIFPVYLIFGTSPTRILGIKYLLSTAYGVGVAAKYSLQRSSPQNLGSKGLTGVFWLFFLILYRIAIRSNEDLRIFSLEFPLKNHEE